MKQPSTPLGLRLRQARKKAGLNQPEIARRLGVSNSLISLWEHGYRIPSLTRLQTVAWICDVDPAWLMFGNSEKTKTKHKPTNQGAFTWPEHRPPDA